MLNGFKDDTFWGAVVRTVIGFLFAISGGMLLAVWFWLVDRYCTCCDPKEDLNEIDTRHLDEYEPIMEEEDVEPI